jgi:hypothetical protein
MTTPQSLRLDVEHEESDRCAGYHCWRHNVDEDGPRYRACYECGHLYRSKRDLRRRYRHELRVAYYDGPNERWDRLRLWWWLLTTRASKVFFCQECSHDFI